MIKIFNGQSKTIIGGAVILGAASLASRFLGIIRDRLLAGEFGAGDSLDVYYAAFRVPDLVFNLLVLGVLSAGFIPVFVNYLKKEDLKDAWFLANNLLNILAVFLIGVCLILIVFTSWIVPLITPGFSSEKISLTVNLTRLMFFSPFLLGLSGVFNCILQSFKRFFVFSLAPIMYNIGIIIGVLFFVDFWGIYGLAYGVILGAFLHLMIQIPALRYLGYGYQWIFNWSHQGLKKILCLTGPRALGLAVVQINLLVITIIASTLDSGSIAIFNLANNLQSLPVGVFGISFAMAAFPAFSHLIAEKKEEEMIKSFSSAFRQILFFIIPASLFLLLLRAQIVRVILGTGNFDWTDTVLTVDSLAFFTLSLFAQALIPLLAYSFYALENTITPFLAGLASAFINIILSLFFSKTLGIAGLALAFSLSNVINLIILWVTLRLRLGNLDEKNILQSIFKISAATLLMGFIIQEMKYIVEPFVNMKTLAGVFTQGFVAGMAGLIFFIALSFLLRSQEMLSFYYSLKNRLKKEKIPVMGIGENTDLR